MSEIKSPPAANQGGTFQSDRDPLTSSNFTAENLSPRWSAQEIDDAVLSLMNDRTRIDQFPAWVQLVYFYGQYTGHKERQSHIDYLENVVEELTIENERVNEDANRYYSIAARGGFGVPIVKKQGKTFADLEAERAAKSEAKND